MTVNVPPQAGTSTNQGWKSGATSAQFIISTVPTAQNPSNVVVKTEAEINDAFKQMSPQELTSLATRLKNAGYRVGAINGKPSRSLRLAYIGAISDLDDEIKTAGRQLDLDSFLAENARSGGSTGPNRTVTTTTITPEVARGLINRVAQDLVGQDLSEEQIAKYTKSLIKAEKARPSVTTYQTSGSTQNVQTTPGLDEQQFLIQQISQSDEAKANQAMNFYSAFKNLLGVQ